MASDEHEQPRHSAGPPVVSRRVALGLGAATLAGAAVGPIVPAAASAGLGLTATSADEHRPAIAGRDAWGAELPVTGPIEREEDVRFLLVHHTASTNDYGPDQVVNQIRGFYSFHTGPEKGWPDVAYNFFIDRFGGIWEARAGSLGGPVRGDATGGSQGFALLCSLIGDHAQVPVSDAARTSLVDLLAWLADRHGIDTTPGATVDFVSRGSNRWPAGTTVNATTIAGHRDMSQTSCPGDLAYDLLADDIPRAVTELRLARTTTPTPDATVAPPTSVEPAPAAPPETDPGADDDGGDGSTRAGDRSVAGITAEAEGTDQAAAGEGPEGDGGLLDGLIVPAALAAGATAAGLAAAAGSRSGRRDPDYDR